MSSELNNRQMDLIVTRFAIRTLSTTFVSIKQITASSTRRLGPIYLILWTRGCSARPSEAGRIAFIRHPVWIVACGNCKRPGRREVFELNKTSLLGIIEQYGGVE